MNIILALQNLIKKYWIILSFLLLISISIISLWPRLNLQIGLSFHDKVFHFLAYFFLALPASIANPKSNKYIYIFFILYGGLIELIQPYFNRSCDIYDFIANILGILLSYYISLKIRDYDKLSC